MVRKDYGIALLLTAGLSVGYPSVVNGKSIKIQENTVAKARNNICGTVTDQNGEPIPGVVVVAKESGTKAVTDIDGHFALPADNKEQLSFKYFGFATVTTSASNNMTVKMKEENHVLGDVIVTAQKKSQSAIDVPTSVSAVTGQNLGKLGISQMDEMATMTPGVQIQLQSPNNPGYVIRGVTSDDGTSTSQPRVSVFTDGVSNSRPRGSASELFDVERVEVVKGPQGTLFGRGAEIGGISIIHNKAKNKLSGELMARYGAYNTRQVTGFINTPIINNKLANRFAFDYDARDGFIRNMAGGRLNGKGALAFRNSTAWWINDKTSLNLILDYQHDSYPGTSFRTKFPGFGVSTDPNAPANLERGKDLKIKRNVGGGTLLLNHDFNSEWKLTSITGLRGFNSDETFDADGTYLPLLNCEEKAEGIQFSQELRMNYDDHKRFSGFGGVSYFYENNSQDVFAHTNLQYLYPIMVQPKLKSTMGGMFTTLQSKVDQMGQQIIAGLPDAYKPAMEKQMAQVKAYVKGVGDKLMESWFKESGESTPDFYGDLKGQLTPLLQKIGSMTGQQLDFDALFGDNVKTLQAISNVKLGEYSEEGKNYSTNHAVEVFADGTYELAKNFNFTLGLRGTWESQKSGYSSYVDPSVFGHVLYHPTNNNEEVTASKNYWSWVGRAALNYLFGRNNVYVSASRGRRPGVLYFNNDPKDLSELKPEIIYSYEAGIKGLLAGGHLRYDLSAYYYDWYHFQTNRFDMEQSKYVADDAGRAHSFGVEASLVWSPIQPLTFFGNYSYIDGKFNDKDEDGNKQEYAGNRFRLTPKHSFTIGADIEIPTGMNGNVYFRPTYTFKSKVYFNDDNASVKTAYGTYDLTQDGYGICNFTAGWRFQPKKVYYEIGIFGKNIFDKKYIIDAGNSGRNIGFPTFIGGTRSVIGGMLKIGF